MQNTKEERRIILPSLYVQSCFFLSYNSVLQYRLTNEQFFSTLDNFIVRISFLVINSSLFIVSRRLVNALHINGSKTDSSFFFSDILATLLGFQSSAVNLGPSHHNALFRLSLVWQTYLRQKNQNKDRSIDPLIITLNDDKINTRKEQSNRLLQIHI